ncbi:MAG: hypothetical protein ABI165_21755, partial [Bryobacteraceae bacterium]
MRNLAVSFLTACLLIRAAPAAAHTTADEDSRELFSEMPKILAVLSGITGWKNAKPVPASIISKDELHRFITGRMKQEMKP